MRSDRYYTYILASHTRVLYIGVTGELERRVHQHRAGSASRFTSRYKCNRLVWFETHADTHLALRREKILKGWLRAKKVALIEQINPTWEDLSATWQMPLALEGHSLPANASS